MWRMADDFALSHSHWSAVFNFANSQYHMQRLHACNMLCGCNVVSKMIIITSNIIIIIIAFYAIL